MIDRQTPSTPVALCTIWGRPVVMRFVRSSMVTAGRGGRSSGRDRHGSYRLDREDQLGTWPATTT